MKAKSGNILIRMSLFPMPYFLEQLSAQFMLTKESRYPWDRSWRL